MRLGVYVYGVAAIATGIIDIVWRGFESAHEPIQAFGDNVPGREIFAYVVAFLLIAGGAAVLRRQSARFGSIALAIVYTIFAIFWLPRFYTAPRVLGLHAGILIGVLGGVCQQLIIVAAAMLIYAWAAPVGSTWPRRAAFWARIVFGFSSIDFGVTHLTGIASAAPLVPRWIPPGQDFWVVLTGVAFVLAGIGILTGILGVLAARLLALMLLVFSVLALAPGIFAYPHNQIAWGANAYNLVAVASVWIYASWIAQQPQPAERHEAAAIAAG
jgi:uncharacterized membrane protein YphA (DoxX/SURF4 family)